MLPASVLTINRRTAKSICLAGLLVCSAATPAGAENFAVILKQAQIGFDNPECKEIEKIGEAIDDRNKIVAMGTISKLLARHQDCLYLLTLRGDVLNAMGSRAQAMAEWEKAIKIGEAKGEHYQRLYEKLLQAYRAARLADGKTVQLIEKMITLFPASRENLLATLASEYSRAGNGAKAAATQARLRALGKPAAPPAPLLALKPTGKDHLPPPQGLEIMARTVAFPKFKLQMSATSAIGDNGVARFIVKAPDYSYALVTNDESGNAVYLRVRELIPRLAGGMALEPDYSKVTEVGNLTIGPLACTQYKCQWVDDCSYDLLTVARDLVFSQAFARVQAQFTGAPTSNFLVLGLTRVEGGFPFPKLQTYKVKKGTFNEDYCKAAYKYHRVKSIDQLIYAENGDVKLDDIKDIMPVQ
ncbi:MAG: hypothetical protein JSS83_04665 [Cyanobacteria bacterium SZAS LIN-3]|nr:hypothetical protein [Cyanobacteria bacterium SZAS LIN-3]